MREVNLLVNAVVAFEKRYHGISSDLGFVEFRRHVKSSTFTPRKELFSSVSNLVGGRLKPIVGIRFGNQFVCGYVNLAVWKVTGISFMQVEFLVNFSWNRVSKITTSEFFNDLLRDVI